MVYLIFGESFSGVIASQALDTCLFLEKKLNKKITPIVFLPAQDFRKQRKRYKKYTPSIIVLPMLVGSRWYRFYTLFLDLLSFFVDTNTCIGRGVKASFICLKARRVEKLIYDGRGAHGAEFEEYFKTKYDLKDRQIREAWEMEKGVVLQANHRIAVSHALVRYWETRFGYTGDQHTIIPCTLNKNFVAAYPTLEVLAAKKQALGFSSEDIILVFSGSAAGWQSFELIDSFLFHLMRQQSSLKVLFLSKLDLNSLKIYKEFPNRIKQSWLPVHEVYATLAMADYGLLFRENTVTNQVAAPVKFAEYLAAGLKVLITEGIGDYSSLIFKHREFGEVINPRKLDMENLKKLEWKEKKNIHEYALENFSKVGFLPYYEKLLSSTS